MTDLDGPIPSEPPVAGDETATLLGSLERQRATFAWKCGGLLERGVSLVVIDVVTERLANLHADLMRLLELGDKPAWQSPSNLYAIAYRTVRSANRHHLEIWPESLSLGRALPTLPLWLDEDNCVPLHLEESYQATCDSLRVRE